MKNRLAGSLSPYLRQHADNPVLWQPWDAEAWAQAVREDKPVLLSVGYAACHWCHVMAHESFEDEETAAVMNANFVCIKTDREERPDIDRVYQAAHYIFARRAGGWPLTMFLTPEGMPFFGGTYFPKTARHGLSSFVSIMEKVAQAWREKREDIEKQNAQVLPMLRALDSHPAAEGAPGNAPVEEAARIYAGMFDMENGGFNGAPKFPHPVEMAFCLLAGGDAAEGARLSLRKIADSGLADHVGGGFYRYAVDERWAIPHFEKMLCDNGLLLALFADAFARFGEDTFARAAEQTAEWILAEMRAPGGGFYASLDADSDGGEGAFYAWDATEIKSLLSPKQWRVFEAHFGMAAGPNFEGKWHLARRQTVAQTAAALQDQEESCEKMLAEALQTLRETRSKRARPALDDKILAAWNGLAISGLARAGRLMNKPGWIAAARDALNFVRQEMFTDGKLCAAWRAGQKSGGAFLDDYAFMLDGALELLRADFDADVLQFAQILAAHVCDDFEDRKDGGFFFTPAGGEKLIRRPKPADDGPIPSGNGVLARVLPLLSYLTGEDRWREAGDRAATALFGTAQKQPAGCPSLLMTLQNFASPPAIVLLSGDKKECERWRAHVEKRHDPRIMALVLPQDSSRLPAPLQKPPQTGGSKAQAHVCFRFSCLPPADSIERLDSILEAPENMTDRA